MLSVDKQPKRVVGAVRSVKVFYLTYRWESVRSVPYLFGRIEGIHNPSQFLLCISA